MFLITTLSSPFARWHFFFFDFFLDLFEGRKEAFCFFGQISLCLIDVWPFICPPSPRKTDFPILFTSFFRSCHSSVFPKRGGGAQLDFAAGGKGEGQKIPHLWDFVLERLFCLLPFCRVNFCVFRLDFVRGGERREIHSSDLVAGIHQFSDLHMFCPIIIAIENYGNSKLSHLLAPVVQHG